jgi:tripartite ATP-independent transporter DctP family solute receptor
MPRWNRREFLTTSVVGAVAASRPRASSGQGRQTLRLAHGLKPTHSLGRSCELLAKRVSELTGGETTIQVYHEGVLGSEGQVAEALQTGTLDMGAIVLFTNAVKLGSVFDIPYLFRDAPHWKRAVEGKPGAMVAETAPAVGLRILGFWIAGWRDIYGSRPINGLADLKGLKIRTLQSRVYVELFKAFGAIPTPIAWPEVYLALLQKTVDAGETALTSMYDAKHYEVAKHVSLTHHALSTNALLVSEQRWKTLSERTRQALVQAEREVREFQHVEYLKDDTNTHQLLRDRGLSFTTPDPTPFRELARSQVYPLVVTDATQKALLDEITKL